MTVQAETIEEVMYLIPKDDSQIDNKVRPERLRQVGITQIGDTTEWKTIESLFSEDKLDALIIHHASLPSVNVSELQDIFMTGVPVAGIGIHGKELADILGLPALYTTTWPPEFGYTTSNFYFIFTLLINGNLNDGSLDDITQIDLNRYIEITRAEADAQKAELEQFLSTREEKAFSLRIKASTDSLNGLLDNFFTMQRILKSHIESSE